MLAFEQTSIWIMKLCYQLFYLKLPIKLITLYNTAIFKLLCFDISWLYQYEQQNFILRVIHKYEITYEIIDG